MFFVKRGPSLGDAKIIVSYEYLQCLVAIDLFKKRQKIRHLPSKWGMFFERAVGTTFSSILVDFGYDFGRVLGAKIGKNTFRRGSKKQSKKSHASDSKSHAVRTDRGGVPYKYPPRRPTHPLRSI